MAQIKVAVIGLGSAAQLIHLPILHKMPNVKVIAACEINKNRLKTVADKFSIENRYTNYEELLAADTADAVIITTPTSSHKEVALRAMEKGIPVFIEKPVARNFAEAKAIADYSISKGVPVMVGMNLRFRPDIQLLKSMIKTKQINDIFYIRSSWYKPQSSESVWFSKREEAGGGVIFDLGIVLLDLVLWLLDFPEISTVSCTNYHHNTKNVEDSSISHIRCANGATIVTESSWSMRPEKNSFALDIYAKDGSATLNPFRVFKKNKGIDEEITLPRNDNMTALFSKSYNNELKLFIDAVRGINAFYSSVTEAVERMKVIEAMYKSAEAGKEIKI